MYNVSKYLLIGDVFSAVNILTDPKTEGAAMISGPAQQIQDNIYFSIK